MPPHCSKLHFWARVLDYKDIDRLNILRCLSLPTSNIFNFLKPLSLIKLNIKATITTFFVHLIFINSFAQSNDFKKHLAQNQENIDLTAANNWNMLKIDAEKNQFIVLGESHGAKNTQLIDYNLLEYLNKTVGTKNYIAELDYAQAQNINEYLKTGNEKALNTVFKYWVAEHAQWGNSDFYNKIVKIRTLNKTLSRKKRITFTGIDAVQDYDRYLKLINGIIKNKNSNLLDSLKLLLNAPFSNESTTRILIFAKNYSQLVSQNEATLNKILKKDYPIFKYLIQNLSYGNKSVGVKRPEAIYRNFEALYNVLHLENEKLYGMWGFFHAHLVPFYFVGQDFVSNLAKSKNPIANKIISIVCLPIDSKYNVWDDKINSWTKEPFSYDNKSLLEVEGIEDVKELTKSNTTTLFKLDGTNSPFAKTGRLVNGSAPQGKLVGDFKNKDYANQYIILMRDSDWLNPLPLNF